MKVLIFEGIATSGKSTVITGLAKRLSPGHKVTAASEDLTHIPIMHEREALHREFFRQTLATLTAGRPDVLLLDRFYMTQALRAKSGLEPYADLERMLLHYDVLTVLLYVQESAIADRIAKATAHRDANWRAYVQTRGRSIAEIVEYYAAQQRGLMEVAAQSKVPYKKFDTTDHAYRPIIEELYQFAK